MHWQTSRFRIDLARPQVMGIVNVTPDSFSDGGRYGTTRAAIAHAEQLIREGADLVDIGGESSRPGAVELTVDEELARVQPVLQAAVTMGVPVSVDTCKPEVMRIALELGVDIVNDIRALTAPQALAAMGAHPSAGVCLMHMHGTPQTMQTQAGDGYGDVVHDVADWLAARLHAVRAAGVAEERVVLDPGIGFGKTVEHNFALLARQRELLAIGRPLLVGWSRKSSLGAVTGRAVGERLAASIAAALAAVAAGAAVLRVHDVAATVDALRVWRAAGLPAPATMSSAAPVLHRPGRPSP